MLNFLFLGGILVNITITKEEFNEARNLSMQRNIPLGDCLNAIQSRNYGFILVSQDRHYFENLKDIIKPVRPQEII